MNVNGRLKRLEEAQAEGGDAADNSIYSYATYTTQLRYCIAQLRQEIAAGHVYEQHRPIPKQPDYITPAYRDSYIPEVDGVAYVLDIIQSLSKRIFYEAGYRWPDDLPFPRNPKTPGDLTAWLDALDKWPDEGPTGLIEAWDGWLIRLALAGHPTKCHTNVAGRSRMRLVMKQEAV